MFELFSTAVAEEAVVEAVAEATAEPVVESVVETVAETVAAQPSWFETAFKKFGSFPLWAWCFVGVLLVLGIVLIMSNRKKKVWTVKMMSFGAICMALSSVLSLVRLWRMPMGGSITPASMLPLIVFAYVYGAGPGVSLGALYGIMQFILDGGEFAWAGLLPNLLDYPLGFACLGLAGLFGTAAKSDKDNTVRLVIGTVVGVLGRFFCSFLSGWIFYGEWAPEGWNPIVYSAVYNISYNGVECLICVALAILIGSRLIKAVKKA